MATDGPLGTAGPVSEEVTATPDLELKLPARAENVAVVRHAFGGFAEALSVDEQTLADIKLAITEACTNVVIHAYEDDEDGSLEVDASIDGRHLEVVIRDTGAGSCRAPTPPVSASACRSSRRSPRRSSSARTTTITPRSA